MNSATKAAIPNANIEVTIAGAATPAGRAVTTADGAFRIQNLALGRYRVLIRALGYRPVEVQAVDIVSASPRTDLGTVALTASAVELQAVEVIVHRQDVLLAPDRNTFVVKDMPTTRGGNALDVLRNVPAVDVDIDNVVSLRGNSAVTVQINGRPSPMKPAQLGNYLSQLPADMVDKVEIIPESIGTRRPNRHRGHHQHHVEAKGRCRHERRTHALRRDDGPGERRREFRLRARTADLLRQLRISAR